MRDLIFKSVLFFFAFTLQVKIADAVELIAPSEEPKGCIHGPQWPCVVSSGDKPRFIQRNDIAQWELDKATFMALLSEAAVKFMYGQAVIKTQSALDIETLFAKVKIRNSKVLLNLDENKLEVMVLSGEPVQIFLRGEAYPQVLMAGFQNYYTGPIAGEDRFEVPKVIDLHQYSKVRAAFFMDYKLGFQSELHTLASHIKWAAKIASQLNRALVERKMAAVEEKQKLIENRSRALKHYDQNIRRLFLKKITYDD